MSPDRDYPPGEHLDAETLAAWVDGGLDARAAAMVETHVSSCDRCQEIVGLIVTTETEAPAAKSWMSRIRAAWLIPLTAGVAAVGLWMIVPTNRPVTAPVVQEAAAKQVPADIPAAPPTASAAPAEELRARDAKRQQPEPAKVDELAKNFNQATSDKAASDKDKKEAKLADQQGARVDRFEERAAAAPPARAMAPPAPAPAAESAGRLNLKAASREITSPDPRTRWRILDGGNVEYSQDAGATWTTVSTGVTEQLSAGSSPTADVCWLVGRNGAVLLTTDGRRWQRLPFPEPLDLIGVVATDARSAQVTAANGASFRTVDAGISWSKQ